MNEQEFKFILTLKPRYFTIFLYCLPREGAKSIEHVITGQRGWGRSQGGRNREAADSLADCINSLCMYHRLFLVRWARVLKVALFLDFIYIHLAASGLSCSRQARHCDPQTSLWRWQAGSVVVVCWTSCSTAWRILGPWAGLEPGSPALTGEFLTTGRPGKP